MSASTEPQIKRWAPEVHLPAPLRWRKPRTIEVFDDPFQPTRTNEEVAAVFGVMAAAPQHTFRVITQWPGRAVEWFKWVESAAWDVRPRNEGEWTVCHAEALLRDEGGGTIHRSSQETAGRPWPLPNVWLGFSAESQKTFDTRWAHAQKWAKLGWHTWVSLKPLLGPVDMTDCANGDNALATVDVQPGVDGHVEREHPPLLSWVVVGGESGLGARPMHPDWARSLRDQCAAAEVPFSFKQWGDWMPTFCGIDPNKNDPRCHVRAGHTLPDGQHMWLVGKRAAGRLLDGVLHDAQPGRTP